MTTAEQVRLRDLPALIESEKNTERMQCLVAELGRLQSKQLAETSRELFRKRRALWKETASSLKELQLMMIALQAQINEVRLLHLGCSRTVH